VPSEIVPDVAPEDGVQPDPQLDPPHVRVAPVTVGALYLPASQFVQTVDAMAAEYLPATQSSHAVLAKPAILHVPANPLFVTEPSDVNVTLRKPVVDV
jgi:hypothetical protein